jgi:hypothetical protein
MIISSTISNIIFSRNTLLIVNFYAQKYCIWVYILIWINIFTFLSARRIAKAHQIYK